MFKVGQQVRFIGVLPNSALHLIGRKGHITSITANGRLLISGELSLHGCRPGNVELVRPLSALEIGLAAYIAAEKKELGLS